MASGKGNTIDMKKLGLSLLFIVIIMSFLYWRYGTSHYTKLGETTFLKTNDIEIKMVTRHEYLPLHYIGDAYSVACKSINTSQFNAWKYDQVEGGWNIIPAPALKCLVADKIECDHLKLAEQAKPFFILADSMTVLVLGQDKLSASFNGCKSFVFWDYKNLPKDLEIQNSADFRHCEEQKIQDKNRGLNYPDVDCRPLNFLNDSKFTFENIKANDTGYLSFSVRSSAFINKEGIKIETNDFGKSWTTKD